MSKNVDTAEVAKFNQLAQQWWDPDGDFKTLHHINPLRLDYILRQTGGLQDKAVLDIGCGGGILSESMAKLGATVTAIDLAEDSIAVARSHAKTQSVEIDYQVVSAEALAEKTPAKFGVITCMEMLEHVPEPESIIAACAGLCRPDGHIILSTINRTFRAFALAIAGAEYILKLIPAGTHQYNNFIRPSELSAWSRRVKLDVIDITGLQYNPITQHASLRKDVSINYMMHLRQSND